MYQTKPLTEMTLNIRAKKTGGDGNDRMDDHLSMMRESSKLPPSSTSRITNLTNSPSNGRVPNLLRTYFHPNRNDLIQT